MFPPAPLCKGQRRENGEEGAQLQGVPSQDPNPWAWGQAEPAGVREVGSGGERNYLGACLGRVGPPTHQRCAGCRYRVLPLATPRRARADGSPSGDSPVKFHVGSLRHYLHNSS